jgi:RNA polymerase sigma-70 factor (ECF subfamily)
MEKHEEAELLRKAQQGDSSSRDALYTIYFSGSKQVQGLLEREVPVPADREDILHDAWLSLVRSKSDFRGDSKLQTFVYRVVQVAILQKLRSDRARRRDKMVRLIVETESGEHELELPTQDYQFESVNASLAAEKLYACVPEPLRTPLRLRVDDELTYQEIAERTGTPINTVATRIFKARAILAKLFGAPADPKAGNKSAARGNQ